MLLTGTYHRSLDEKHRFSVPKRLRDALGQDENSVMYLAPGTDGSLSMYTEEAFARMGEQLAQGSPTGRDVRDFSRLFYSQAQQVDMDRQGRVRIPPELAELAGLTKEIVLLGVRDRLEIWDKAHWLDYLNAKQAQYDEIAENAFASPGAQSNGQPAGPSVSQRPTQPR